MRILCSFWSHKNYWTAFSEGLKDVAWVRELTHLQQFFKHCEIGCFLTFSQTSQRMIHGSQWTSGRSSEFKCCFIRGLSSLGGGLHSTECFHMSGTPEVTHYCCGIPRSKVFCSPQKSYTSTFKKLFHLIVKDIKEHLVSQLQNSWTICHCVLISSVSWPLRVITHSCYHVLTLITRPSRARSHFVLV